MSRVLAPLLCALCVAAALPPAASAAKSKSCGTVTAFHHKFRITAKGPGCSFARSTFRCVRGSRSIVARRGS